MYMIVASTGTGTTTVVDQDRASVLPSRILFTQGATVQIYTAVYTSMVYTTVVVRPAHAILRNYTDTEFCCWAVLLLRLALATVQ